jgi:glycosyltransferase involved in cell wall biosynthesis
MLEQITPLVLTFNEAPNIRRTFDRLTWAKRVVVVDSWSDDETQAIATSYPNVDFMRRRFDLHANQWNFGLRETGIDTEWVLALDADFVLTDAFIREVQSLAPPANIAGYRARFRYCIDGIPLGGTVYTPVTVLFRRTSAGYAQQGHTQRVEIAGNVATLRAPISHDDRKSLERWFGSQIKYMELEAKDLLAAPITALDLPDMVRRLVFVAPIAMFLYCLLAKRTLFDGSRGLRYACERAIAELILSLFLLQGLLDRRRE